MGAIIVPSAAETRDALGQSNTWPEAEIVAEPVSAKKLGEEPRLLVRRLVPDIAGPNNERLFYLPGQPVVSLFTGAGGMDIGVERAGFCTVVQCEWDMACCQTLVANRPQFFRRAALLQCDIRYTSTYEILDAAGLRVGEAAMVCGGPPCQGFSLANSKRAVSDPRNNLVFEYLRVVRQSQPSFFVFENVPGFQTLGKGHLFEEFLRTAHAAGYELVYGLINAVDHGVPQNRVRFLCTGTRRDLWEIAVFGAG